MHLQVTHHCDLETGRRYCHLQSDPLQMQGQHSLDPALLQCVAVCCSVYQCVVVC